MLLGVLDYGLLFTSTVPVKMFDDLQVIQNLRMEWTICVNESILIYIYIHVHTFHTLEMYVHVPAVYRYPLFKFLLSNL